MNSRKFIKLISVGYITASLTTSIQADPGIKEVLIHSPLEPSSHSQMALTNRSHMSMESRAQKLFDVLDPNIKIKSTVGSAFNLLQSNIRTNEYKFEINGIPMCQFQLKSHETINGTVSVLGKVPNVVIDQNYKLSEWPSLQETLDLSQNIRFEKGIEDSFLISSKEPCLWVTEGQIRPVWDLVLTADRLQYSVIADDSEVYKFQNRHFHADGKATVYSTNPVDGVLTDYDVTNLIPNESGRVLVENDKFITLLDTNTYDYFADFEAPYEFTTDVDQESFKEISLFTNAVRTLSWLESLGYTNFGSTPIRIVVHAVFGEDNNNALYQPGDDYSTIFVGDGDGQILQNLALDYDVIAHELGHHVVYHSIKDIQNESLVLHEGLADFFTYAKTGNSCLGESICPSSSGICAVANQCLRTADNDYSLTSSDLPPEAHLRSQFISGYLWDLYNEDGISLDILTQMVLQAINLFVSDSGYTHFILGLMIVDESSFDGQYCSKIYDRAVVRGLSSRIADYPCTSMSALVASSGGDIETMTGENEPAAESTNTSKKSNSFCGSISLSSNGHFSILFLIATPFFIRLRRRF